MVTIKLTEKQTDFLSEILDRTEDKGSTGETYPSPEIEELCVIVDEAMVESREGKRGLRKEYKMDKLTDSDYAMVEYFWQEKGDITRWTGWERKKVLFEKECPEFVKAFNSYIIYGRIISAIIKSWND